MATKKKDAKMAKFGSKGSKGLVKRLGSAAAVSAHYSKLAKRRWKLHPEQRSKKAR